MSGTSDLPLRLSPEEREEVRAALRRGTFPPGCANAWRWPLGRRSLGRDLGEIAAWSVRKPRTVRRWLGAFASGGTGALADVPRSGHPVVADAAYIEALEEALRTPPLKLGLGFDV